MKRYDSPPNTILVLEDDSVSQAVLALIDSYDDQPDTLSSLGFMGVNLESHDDWHMNRFYVDVMKDSRGFDCAAGVDSAGWPKGPWQVVLSTKNGACNPGTYKGRYNNTVSGLVQASAGVKLTETGVVNGYMTFDLVVPPYVPANGNMIIAGSKPVIGLEIVRPGFLPGIATNPLFNPDSLKYLSVADSIRYMKPLAVEAGGTQPNGGELLGGVWANRNTPNNRRGGFSHAGMPHEYVIAQANALQPTGLKSIWINLWFNQSDADIVSQLSMYRDTLNKQLLIYIEYANENWNSFYVAVFNYMLSLVMTELDGSYAKGDSYGWVNRFSSISCDGKTATIKFKTAHNRKTGDKVVFSNMGTWNYNGAITAVDTLTITFPFTLAASVLDANNSGAVYIGLPNTGVHYDGWTDINLLTRRMQIKRVYQIGLLVEQVFGSAVGTRARMMLGQQQGDANPGGGLAPWVYKYIEDQFPARKLSEVVYSCALHPYTDNLPVPNTNVTAADIKAQLDATIARNVLELKRFIALNVCYGLKTCIYEWAPSFFSNGAANAAQLAFQKDDLMRQHQESAHKAYHALGIEVEHFFHFTPCDDWNNSTDSNLNWYTNADPINQPLTPKQLAFNNAKKFPHIVDDALNLISGPLSEIDATNFSRVDQNVPGNNLGWTRANSGTPGAGQIGFDRAGSFNAIGAKARFVEWGILVNAAGNYTLNLWAFASNQAGTPEPVTITLDGNSLCVYQLPGIAANKIGNFINTACVAGVELPVTLQAGFHRLRLSVAASNSGAIAIQKMMFKSQ